VNVRARLSWIVWTIIRRIVVVVMTVVVTMAMVNMVLVAVRVGVNEKARERADWRSASRADDRRHRKHDRHCPHQGNAASACSFQSRQHALRSTISGRRFQGVCASLFDHHYAPGQPSPVPHHC
jgi:hypothetical protein